MEFKFIIIVIVEWKSFRMETNENDAVAWWMRWKVWPEEGRSWNQCPQIEAPIHLALEHIYYIYIPLRTAGWNVICLCGHPQRRVILLSIFFLVVVYTFTAINEQYNGRISRGNVVIRCGNSLKHFVFAWIFIIGLEISIQHHNEASFFIYFFLCRRCLTSMSRRRGFIWSPSSGLPSSSTLAPFLSLLLLPFSHFFMSQPIRWINNRLYIYIYIVYSITVLKRK